MKILAGDLIDLADSSKRYESFVKFRYSEKATRILPIFNSFFDIT